MSDDMREQLRKAAQMNQDRPDWTKRRMPTLAPRAEEKFEDCVNCEGTGKVVTRYGAGRWVEACPVCEGDGFLSA